MEEKRPRKKKIIAVVATVAAAILIVGYLTTVYAAKPEEEEVLLREYPISRGDITAGVSGQGTLGVDTDPINFDAPVTVEEVYVKAGDAVKKGDKIARAKEEAINEKIAELETKLKKAEIALSDARNNLAAGALALNNNANPADEGSAEYQASRGQLQAEADELIRTIENLRAHIGVIDGQFAQMAEDDPSREYLQNQKIASQEELSAAQAELNSKNAAISNLDAARDVQVKGAAREQETSRKEGALKQGTLSNAVRLAEMEIEDIKKQIEKERALLDSPYLYSDRDGIVLEVGYGEGMETKADTPVVKIGNMGEIYGNVQVSQADIGDIEEGQKVELTLDAFPGQIFYGEVIKKIPAPIKDSNPVAYAVYVKIEGGEEELLMGMTLSAQFILKQAKDVLMLSNKAIALDGNTQYVLLKDEDGALYRREISTGFSDGKMSEIVSGLEEGEIVYVEG